MYVYDFTPCQHPKTDNVQHSQRKRELADRYAMTNILREEHVAAITDRAKAFASRCAASFESVDVYVGPLYSPLGVVVNDSSGVAALLCPRWCNKLHV